MSGADSGSSVQLDVNDDVKIHDTKDPDEIYVTNPSKMKLVLYEFEKAIRIKNRIINPIVLGVTTLSVLFVSDFNTTLGLSPQSWKAIFILITLGCLLWLIISIVKMVHYWEQMSPEYVVEELKSAE